MIILAERKSREKEEMWKDKLQKLQKQLEESETKALAIQTGTASSSYPLLSSTPDLLLLLLLSPLPLHPLPTSSPSVLSLLCSSPHHPPSASSKKVEALERDYTSTIATMQQQQNSQRRLLLNQRDEIARLQQDISCQVSSSAPPSSCSFSSSSPRPCSP
eukprot:768361-Hanusia_phi.AAC.4